MVETDGDMIDGYHNNTFPLIWSMYVLNLNLEFFVIILPSWDHYKSLKENR
jgi:hypothetical protein